MAEIPGHHGLVSAESPPSAACLARPAWSGLLVVAAVLVAVEMAVSARYGYHRDELYFLAASKHLVWGYVDQPPLTVALAGLAQRVFGDRLIGLRLLPALAVGVAVVLTGLTGLTGLIARELAGAAASRAAQILAAACVAGSGVTIAIGHLHSTTTFNLVFWTALLLTLVRLLRTGDARLWFVVGVLASPYLAWQAGHGWPQFEIFADLRRDDGGLGAGLAFIPLQALMTNPFLTPVWLLGLLWLLRSPEGRRWRPVAVGYLLRRALPAVGLVAVIPLPAAERTEAVVVTGNYGEAGALERFATVDTATRTFSGHTSLWFFDRPARDDTTAIVVGYSQSWLGERFDSVALARRLDNGADVENEEQGTPVWICRGSRGSWASTWIDWRHYDG